MLSSFYAKLHHFPTNSSHLVIQGLKADLLKLNTIFQPLFSSTQSQKYLFCLFLIFSNWKVTITIKYWNIVSNHCDDVLIMQIANTILSLLWPLTVEWLLPVSQMNMVFLASSKIFEKYKIFPIILLVTK